MAQGIANLIEATDADFQQKVLDADGPVVVDFWAPWCMPCRMQAPELERFAQANPSVRVVKVNTDESPLVANRFGIRSIPTILVFNKGRQVTGAIGLQRSSQLAALVEEAKAAV